MGTSAKIEIKHKLFTIKKTIRFNPGFKRIISYFYVKIFEKENE